MDNLDIAEALRILRIRIESKDTPVDQKVKDAFLVLVEWYLELK